VIESQDEFGRILNSTTLAGHEIAELQILDTDERAIAVDIDVSELEEGWRSASARSGQ